MKLDIDGTRIELETLNANSLHLLARFLESVIDDLDDLVSEVPHGPNNPYRQRDLVTLDRASKEVDAMINRG